MSWLPPKYTLPENTGGNYTKLIEGANKLRIMSQPIIGWVYWTKDSKPVRLQERPAQLPADIRDGDKPKHMWAFVVWNYGTNALQIMEITQASIQGPIQDLVANEDWGDPREYDITITKTGQKLDTEYSVMPSPRKEAPAEALGAFSKTPIRLEALFEGGDPFAALDVVTEEDSPFPPKF